MGIRVQISPRVPRHHNAAPRGHACYPSHTPRYLSEAASLKNEGQDKTQFRESFMMFTNWVRLIWIFCLAAAGASSAQAQMESQEKFVCTSGAVKRVVTIVNGKRESGGCRVDYTKDGQTKTVEKRLRLLRRKGRIAGHETRRRQLFL
jgi:hypothetical protein